MAKVGGRRSSGNARRRPTAKLKTSSIKKRRTTQNRRSTNRSARPMPRPKRTKPSFGGAGTVKMPRSTPSPRPVSRTSRSSAPSVSSQPSLQDQLITRQQTLQRSFTQLDRNADLGDVYDELGRIEEMFTMLPAKLDELRARGYVHSGGLEDRLDLLDEDWDTRIRPNVEKQLQQAVFRLDKQVDSVQRAMAMMGGARLSSSLVSSAERSMSTAESAVRTARNNVRSLFQGVLTALGDVKTKVHSAEWMVEHIEQSPEIELLPAEGPVMAVEAEWEQGAAKDGPDGVLILTDQRLLFEQKEEVATKKFLFITRESEMVQELMIDVDIDLVEEIEADEESGGIFGMKKNDILELVFSGEADISRARFHIRGSESSDWLAMIKRVKSGDIDEDRAEDYVDEAEEAEALTAAMPEICPFCMAPLPSFTRGVSSHTCEFCGNLVTAEVEDASSE